MSSDSEPQLKYSYRFRLEAKTQGVFDEDKSKAEVQAYINELLGAKDKPQDKEHYSSA